MFHNAFVLTTNQNQWKNTQVQVLGFLGFVYNLHFKILIFFWRKIYVFSLPLGDHQKKNEVVEPLLLLFFFFLNFKYFQIVLERA